MTLWHALRLRLGAAAPQHAYVSSNPGEPEEAQLFGQDPKRLFLVVGLGVLSWVATYVGMLELIEANLVGENILSSSQMIMVISMATEKPTMILWMKGRSPERIAGRFGRAKNGA